MSGWIKVEKDLPASIRFRRVVTRIRERNALPGVTDCDDVFLSTLVLGALMRLWMYADTHIADDNTIEGTAEEIDALVGVPGFAQAMPDSWLIERPDGRIELPDFLSKNGTSAKQRRDAAKRQAAFRARRQSREVTRDVTGSHASNEARPDQTRLDQKKKEDRSSAMPTEADAVSRGTVRRLRQRDAEDPEWLLQLKQVLPRRAGDMNWRGARRAGNARLQQGHTVEQFLEGGRRYAAYIRAIGKEGTEFVMQAARFVGPDLPFMQPWDPPASIAQRRQDSAVAAGLAFLAEGGAK